MSALASRERTAEPFRLRLLGPLAVQYGSVSLDPSRWPRWVASLLTLLALAPGHRRTREELVDLLWPEAAPETGQGHLRYVVHLLRRHLSGTLPPGSPSPVLTERGWLSLDLVYRWEIDVQRFQELARSHELAALEEAAELYRGEPLVEHRYEDWAMPMREGLQRTWRELCFRLADAYRDAARPADAIRWLERLRQADPLDEEAIRRLVSLLHELGRRPQALRVYQQFEQRLQVELGIPPMPETATLVGSLKDKGSPGPRSSTRAITLLAVPVIPSYPLPIGDALVGRTAELERVLDLLPPAESATEEPMARPARSHVILLGAEAGMGKTRLLAEVAKRAREMGAVTLAGGCYEQEGRLPYGPIRDALLDYLRAQPPALLRAQLDDLLLDLARIIPEVGVQGRRAIGGHRRDPESERTRLFSVVAQTLERISRARAVVLLLDDLHWADEATLQLLHFLLRQPTLDRVLLVGTYREEELLPEGHMAQLAKEMEETGQAMHLALPPLSSADLSVLLAERLGRSCAPELIQELHTRSGGNPFFALQMLRLLQEEGRLQDSPNGWRAVEGTTIGLPAAVRDTIMRRLRGLGPDEREVLTLGAVLGREFAYVPLDALWEESERSLFAALDRAVEVHILHETDSGYAFRHPLLWDVVYQRVPAPRRALLHERAALELEALYGEQAEEHAAELAHNFVTAGRVHVDRALHYLVVGGDQATHAYAHAEAERQYRLALDLARQVGDRPREAELLEKLGRTLALLGHYDQALDLLEEAAGRHREVADLERELLTVALLGQVYFDKGSPREGIACLQPTAAMIEERACPVEARAALAAVFAKLAVLLYADGRYAEQLLAAGRASELAQLAGDDRLVAEAEVARGVALWSGGEVQGALSVLEVALPLAEAAGDLDALNTVLHNLAAAYLFAGALQRSRECRERALEASTRMGSSPARRSYSLACLGHILFLLGDWDQARAHLEQAALMSESVDWSWRSTYPLLLLAELEVAVGRWDEACAHLQKGIAFAERSEDRQALHIGYKALAEHDILADQPEAAVTRLQSVLDRSGERTLGVLQVLPYLAWAHLERSKEAEEVRHALEIVTDCAVQARRQGIRLILVDALRVRGMILGREKRWDSALDAIEEALSLARHMSYPYAEAQVLHEWGRLHLAKSEPQPAREYLRAALAIFERLRARPYVERTEQALRAASAAQ